MKPLTLAPTLLALSITSNVYADKKNLDQSSPEVLCAGQASQQACKNFMEGLLDSSSNPAPPQKKPDEAWTHDHVSRLFKEFLNGLGK